MSVDALRFEVREEIFLLAYNYPIHRLFQGVRFWDRKDQQKLVQWFLKTMLFVNALFQVIAKKLDPTLK